MAKSSPLDPAPTRVPALKSQYNNLRDDVLSPTEGHPHTGEADKGIKLAGLACLSDIASAATPSTVVVRDGSGRSRFANPENDADAATKSYVDTAVGGSGSDLTTHRTAETIDHPNDSVTNAKLRNSAALSVIGRAANSSGDPADISAAANDRLLARTSDALGFTQLTAGMVPDGLLANAKLTDMPQYSVKVNASVDSAAPQDITGAVGEVLAIRGPLLGGLDWHQVSDDLLGDRVAAFAHRQGGDEDMWGVSGETDYVPGKVLVQCGSVLVEIEDLASAGTKTIIFPEEFAYRPLMPFLSMSFDPSTDVVIGVDANTLGTTAFTIQARRTGTSGLWHAYVSWLTIGPRAEPSP